VPCADAGGGSKKDICYRCLQHASGRVEGDLQKDDNQNVGGGGGTCLMEGWGVENPTRGQVGGETVKQKIPLCKGSHGKGLKGEEP